MANEVPVTVMPACYVTGRRGYVLVLRDETSDPRSAMRVERFVAEEFVRQGRHVMRCEGVPFGHLFGLLMAGFHIPGLSHCLDRLHPTAHLASSVPDEYDWHEDAAYVKAYYGGDLGDRWARDAPLDLLAIAQRRAYLEGPDQERLQRYLSGLPKVAKLHAVIETQWPSTQDYRDHLYGGIFDELDQLQGQVHTLLDALTHPQLLAVLAWLAGDYWGRRSGWPDLLTWTIDSNGPMKDPRFVEVKSQNDRLNVSQRAMFAENSLRMHLPLSMVRVTQLGTCPLPSAEELGLGEIYPANKLAGELPLPAYWHPQD